MKKFSLVLGLLISFSLFLFGCSQQLPLHPGQLQFEPLSFQPPEVDSQLLDNGIRLYLKEDNELPLVQITAMIGAGAVTTPEEKTGFGGVFGTTWRTGGAGDRSAEELDDYLERLAADMSASMGPYSTKLDISLRAKDLEEGVGILADMLRRPGFDQTKLELAKLQAQESVRRQNDNPRSISRRLLMSALYPNHYLGYQSTNESIDAIDRDDLVQFKETYFAPNMLRLAVSGDFNRDQLISLFNKYFADWPAKDVPAQNLQVPERPVTETVQVVAKEIPQTSIVIGDVGLTKDNPDQYAVKVMNYILGGGGFNSRLMREIRSDRGLAYSAYSYFQVGRRLPGPFIAATETKSESVVPALTLAREIMADMRETRVSAADLALAKESLINSFVFGFENSHSVVSRQMDQDFFGYPEDYLSSYRDHIAAVTIDDVQRVARKYIRPERQQIVLVGDLKSFRDELKEKYLVINEVDLNALSEM